jgi:hypothetical protein
MKFLAFILAVCLLASCSKEDVSSPVADTQTEPITCDFGLNSFNTTKRGPVEDITGKGKPPRFTWNTGTSTTTPAVILLDFDGHTVSNTVWNSFSDIVCAPANLSSDALATVFNRIANDYSPFNVTITTDEALFNGTAVNRRMRVIFTETWEWFGQAGGAAFLNTFGMSNNTPCFVFTSLLNYNTKTIAEAGSHEMGHTLGLSHQSSYSGTSMLNQYNYGVGSGETAWAPIMGCAYYRNLSTWHNGATSNGYNAMQDEVAMITTKLGTQADDYSGTSTGAQTLSGSKSGIINAGADEDCFYVSSAGSTTVTVTPYNVGPENAGANLDLVLKVYNSSGALVNTINDPSVLHASAVLNAGEYFVTVSVAANANASAYGMIGKYSITKN